MQLGPELMLGDFKFPLPPKDSLDFDMKRAIPKLEFPGGPPEYQDMGMSEKTLDFSGTHVGDDALDVNDQLETLWWSGKEMILSYGDLQKTVRIESYRPKIRRTDRVDYSIHLIVCFPESERTTVADAITTTAIEDAVTADPVDTAGSLLDKTYTVQAGDTLWGIAARADVFGDGSKWGVIAAGNGITDETSLQVGQVIKIPSASNAAVSEQSQTLIRKKVLATKGQDEINQIILDQELSDQQEMDRARRIANGEL